MEKSKVKYLILRRIKKGDWIYIFAYRNHNEDDVIKGAYFKLNVKKDRHTFLKAYTVVNAIKGVMPSRSRSLH